MSIVTVPGFAYPIPYATASTPIAFSALTLGGAGQKAAVIFRAPKAGNIHKGGLMLGAITAGVDTDVRFETLSAQFPTGTLAGTNTNGTILSASLAANAMNMATLTADLTVAAGDLLALVFAPTGSPNYAVNMLSASAQQLPYPASHNGASYSAASSAPIAAIEYSDGSYALIPGCAPISAVNTHTFNSGSTPDEIGAKFKLPVSMRALGGWIGIDIDNALDMVLYAADGVTVLDTAPLISAGRSTGSGRTPYYFDFPNLPTIPAGVYCYLSAKPGASNISLYSWDVLLAAALDQLGGQDWHYVSAKDPSGTGSWTAVTTRYPVMGLLVNGIDVPAPPVGMITGARSIGTY